MSVAGGRGCSGKENPEHFIVRPLESFAAIHDEKRQVVRQEKKLPLL